MTWVLIKFNLDGAGGKGPALGPWLGSGVKATVNLPKKEIVAYNYSSIRALSCA